MSLQLLEDNWETIIKKVINPLWELKFKTMYHSVKLDKDDFISLAGEELTKAFLSYNAEESNVFTYSKTVLTRKATTEFRDKRREKRKADLTAESLYQKIDENSEKTLGDVIENIAQSEENENLELKSVTKAIHLLLKPKERKIIDLAMKGLENKDIAIILHMDIKNINSIKKRIANNSQIIRILKISGYLGGCEDEI